MISFSGSLRKSRMRLRNREDGQMLDILFQSSLIADLFPGWSLEECVRIYECAFSALSILGFVFVIGLPSPSRS
jgi:hypothetical protein